MPYIYKCDETWLAGDKMIEDAIAYHHFHH